jgi:hypothetical protein
MFDNETQRCVPNDLMAAETQLYRPDTAREKGEPDNPGEPSSAGSQHWHSLMRYIPIVKTVRYRQTILVSN